MEYLVQIFRLFDFDIFIRWYQYFDFCLISFIEWKMEWNCLESLSVYSYILIHYYIRFGRIRILLLLWKDGRDRSLKSIWMKRKEIENHFDEAILLVFLFSFAFSFVDFLVRKPYTRTQFSNAVFCFFHSLPHFPVSCVKVPLNMYELQIYY